MATGNIRREWTNLEDGLLRAAVTQCAQQRGSLDWPLIAIHVPGRDRKACRKRWLNTLNVTGNTGHWDQDEDQRLLHAVEINGTCWSRVANIVQTRNGDQCQKRWKDALDPNIYRGEWTEVEDQCLQDAVNIHGSNWTQIATQHFPYRSALSIRHRMGVLRNQATAVEKANAAQPVLFLNDPSMGDNTRASGACV